jgi:Icc-related predicted phosphoesterase
VKERFADVDFVLGCGDLPYYYLEYLVDQLGKPVFFVRGNHAATIEYSQGAERTGPWGAVDLHQRLVNFRGILIAGFEGSVRYRKGPFMYTQTEMWNMVLRMVPRLIVNAVRHGQEDPAHRGFQAFRWLLKVFKPRYHFHGHIHVYSKETPVLTRFHDTLVINTYGYRETNLHLHPLQRPSRAETPAI